MQFINLIAGILLILLGLRLLRKGFARVMGGDLLDWLQDFTRTRTRAAIGGVAAGVVMPSSTAMALLSVDMTRDEGTTWRNVLAVLLGAQLGITVLVQVLAFNLQDYAGLFLAAGGVLYLFVERSRPKGVGQALLALAFVFLGMGFISQAAAQVGGDPAVEDLFSALAALPLLFLAGALLLTLLVQSSTASIAVALGLVASGQVSLSMLLMWVIGANIGLCLTALIAGWNRLDGRRLGLAVLVVKLPLAAVAVVLILSLGDDLLGTLPGTSQQQAAWAHTLFNLVACVGILLSTPLEHLVRTLIPEPEADDDADGQVPRLDPLLLQNPALAINAALRETLRVFDMLHVMREEIVGCIRDGTLRADLRASVMRRSERILQIREEMMRFLDAVPDDALGVEDAALKETMDDFLREMPLIVRTLGRELLEGTQTLLREHADGLPGYRDLALEASDRLGRQMEIVARMLLQEKPELGREILRNKKENSTWLIHHKRTRADLPMPAWKILDDFQQLNRRLSGVAYVYCREEPGADDL
ncbi:MAG: Na/Pi cotransporter family protein [Gemmatimonadales bacterium]|nr:MAG: Na/Pi cotransporter family protein [Gemmatimonadales bacterium]